MVLAILVTYACPVNPELSGIFGHTHLTNSSMHPTGNIASTSLKPAGRVLKELNDIGFLNYEGGISVDESF